MKKYPVYSIRNFDCNSVHSDLYVNTFKNHLLGHSFIEKPHRHDFYVLVLFTSGTGSHVIDFNHFIIQSGSVFVMQPGQMHQWSLSEDIEGFIVFFSKEIYNLYFGQKDIDDYPFYSKVNSSPEIVLNTDEIKSIIPLFDVLVVERQQNQLLQREKIMNILDIIHIELARKYSDSFQHDAHSYNVKLNRFGILLEENFKIQKGPLYYAAQLHITLKHLNRITREVVNKTTTQVITDRVMLEAKRMLMEKQLSVNEIASALGYDDYSYFSRLFKKNSGMTTTEFRAQKV